VLPIHQFLSDITQFVPRVHMTVFTSSCYRCLPVNLSVANKYGPAQVKIEVTLGLEKHAWCRLAAFTSVIPAMRTVVNPIDRSPGCSRFGQQLPVDRIQV
jgi:hypothetical protein